MSRPLRAVVADDEPLARARLARLLGEDGAVEIVTECADGASALAAIRSQRPDIAFLDIRMPGVDGLQVAEQAADARTHVVFVTAFGEHALRAFDSGAADYLLKPYSAQRLRSTLQRVRARLAAAADAYPERLLLRTGARMRLVSVAEIDALLASANYVEVCCGEVRHLARTTLNAMAARLDPACFVRIHRSRLVRIGAVRDIELLPSGQYLLRLHGGQRLSSGRSFRDQVRDALDLRER